MTDTIRFTVTGQTYTDLVAAADAETERLMADREYDTYHLTIHAEAIEHKTPAHGVVMRVYEADVTVHIARGSL